MRDLKVVHDFLSEQECAYWIDRLRVLDRRDTKVLNEIDPTYGLRNRLKIGIHGDDVEELKQRVARELDLPPHMETARALIHTPGGGVNLHWDHFQIGREGPRFLKQYMDAGGQRIVTAMIYLNRPARGGGLYFPRLGRVYAEEAGKLVAFRTWRDGRPLLMSEHTGMVIEQGTKYALQVIFRERTPGVQRWERLPDRFYA